MITREPEFFPPPPNLVASLGRHVLFTCRAVGQATLLLAQAVVATRFALTRRARHEIVVQMFVSGIKSLGVITIVEIALARRIRAAGRSLDGRLYLNYAGIRFSRVRNDEPVSTPSRRLDCHRCVRVSLCVLRWVGGVAANSSPKESTRRW